MFNTNAKKMDNFYSDNQKPTTMQSVGALAVTAAVLFGVVYLVGRAWKSSQQA